ncbi:MAG: pyridoxamine 5'-phosphate oxidase [Acetobacterales bacterium]
MSDLVREEPVTLFQEWLKEAGESEPNDPNAMALATVDGEGRPSVRMVLLKGVDAGGFVFYTNLQSRKGDDLAGNANAAMCFHWKTLRRQVRVEGAVSAVTDEEADAYFASRARGSQIGAWASEQSRELPTRFELEKRIASYTAKFNIGSVPRPPHWSGFRLAPRRVEFWRDRNYRLHERIVYSREGDAWTTRWLFP